MVYLVTEFIGMYSGAAVVALDLAESLANAGKQTGVIYLGEKIPPGRNHRNCGYKLYKMPYLPIRKGYSKGLKGSFKYAIKRAESGILHALLQLRFKSHVPDVLIFNDYVPSTVNVLDRYGDRYKTVYVVHVSPHYIKNFEEKIVLAELLAVFKTSDALVFVSDECRKKWLSFPELRDKKSYYIPNCADERVAENLLKVSKDTIREKLDMKRNKFYLVSVASLQERKGQDLLVKSAAALKEIAPNLEILIIGGGKGRYAERLKSYVQQHNLDFVSFLGRKSNSMEYIYASDAFILTSRAEALPLVILEAMVLQTPVLSSNIDGVPEMIDNRVSGLLFESENLESLVKMFEELFENEIETLSYAKRASQKYWENFSNNRFMNRYDTMINELKVG